MGSVGDLLGILGGYIENMKVTMTISQIALSVPFKLKPRDDYWLSNVGIIRFIRIRIGGDYGELGS